MIRVRLKDSDDDSWENAEEGIDPEEAATDFAESLFVDEEDNDEVTYFVEVESGEDSDSDDPDDVEPPIFQVFKVTLEREVIIHKHVETQDD